MEGKGTATVSTTTTFKKGDRVRDIKFGETSPGIGVPQWWYTIWLPVMSVAIAGRALGLFVRRGRRA